MHAKLPYCAHKPSNPHHRRLIINWRHPQHPVVCALSTRGLQVASKRAANSAMLSTRLSKCTDLASIHALLLQQAGRTHDALPGVFHTQLATDTRPADAVAAFRHLAARWRSSAQGPLEAALLSDALQFAYALLNVHLSFLQPREVAAIINSLAGLRSANPEVLRRLADSLARRPAPAAVAMPLPGNVMQQSLAGMPAPVSTSVAPPPQPLQATSTHFPSSPVVAASASTSASGSEEPPSTSMSGSSLTSAVASVSAAPGLARLTSPELAAVVSALAAFNLRPGDAWLGLCMSCLQLGLPFLSGPQLAQLLWALVQLGVRPTSPWLALYEEALSRCLERHLEDPEAATEGAVTAPEMTGHTETQQPKQSKKSRSRAPQHHRHRQQGPTVAPAAATAAGDELSCADLVRVLSASAEVAFQPGERCRTLLLAALGSRLRDMQPHQVAGLAWGMTRLGWQVDARWRDTFLQVTWSLLPQLRAADLTAVLDFVARARLSPTRTWLRRCLETSLPHLPQVSPRDLPGLLFDLTELDDRLFAPRGAAATAVTCAFNASPGGGATVALGDGFPGPAAVATTPATRASEATGIAAATKPGPGDIGQQRGTTKESQGKIKGGKGVNDGGVGHDDDGNDGAERGLEALAAAWLRRYLQLCTEKLSRFTAGGVAQMMVAVARSGGLADARWLQAACATLASKSDVLGANDMADAVIALAALRRRRFEVLAVQPSTRNQGPQPADAVSWGGINTADAAAAKGVASASASRSSSSPSADGRIQREQRVLLEALLSRCTTKLSLLPDDRLVGLMAGLAELDVRPDSAWLGTLLDMTLTRMTSEAAAPSAPPSLATLPASLPMPAPMPNPPERSLQEPSTAAVTSSSPSAAATAESDLKKLTPWAPSDLRLPSVAPAGSGSVSSRAFSPRLLSELLVSVAKLGVVPPRRWTRAFLEAASRQLEGFDAASLNRLLWGLVVLDMRPSREWTNRLMEHVRQCLPAEEQRSGGPGSADWGERYDMPLVWAAGQGGSLMLSGEEGTGGSLAKPAAEDRVEMLTVLGLGLASVPAGEAAGSRRGVKDGKGKEEGIRRDADTAPGEGEAEETRGGRVRRAKPYGYLPRRYSASSSGRALPMTV